MQEPRFRPDVLCDVGQKRDDVVSYLALDLVDPIHFEAPALPHRARGLLGDRAELGHRIRCMRLDLEPDLEPGLRRPDPGHFGSRVAGYHRQFLLRQNRTAANYQLSPVEAHPM